MRALCRSITRRFRWSGRRYRGARDGAPHPPASLDPEKPCGPGRRRAAADEKHGAQPLPFRGAGNCASPPPTTTDPRPRPNRPTLYGTTGGSDIPAPPGVP